jgi:hypothetical protein
MNTPMTNKILRLALLANLIFAEHAANEPTRSLINQGEQQSAFIAHGNSAVFYQMPGISVTPLLPVGFSTLAAVEIGLRFLWCPKSGEPLIRFADS